MLRLLGWVKMGERESFLQDMEAMLDRKNKALESKINQNTDTQFASMSSQIYELSKVNKTMVEKVTNHETRLENIEKKNVFQDKAERSSNIIIYGIKETTYAETLKKTTEILNHLIPELNKYSIKNIIKLNKGGWKSDGPIKVSLISSLIQSDIMRSKHKLQGSDIRIAEDLSDEYREARKKLAPFSLKEKNKGNKVFMRRDTLVINGKSWTLNELQNYEEPTDPTTTNSDTPKPNSTGKGSLKRTRDTLISPQTQSSKVKNDDVKRNKVDKPETRNNLMDLWSKIPGPKDGKAKTNEANKDTEA